MAATKRQMNWAPVSFTPSGGSLTTCTGVTNVTVNTGGNLLKFSGDGDRFTTLVVNDYNDPSIAITTADVVWCFAIAPGTRGSLVATHKDAKNAVGGALTFTLANAVAESPQDGGAHRQIGSASISFSAESTDGTTNPLSYALA